MQLRIKNYRYGQSFSPLKINFIMIKRFFLYLAILYAWGLSAQERETVAQTGNTSSVITGFLTKPAMQVDGNTIDGNRFLFENWKNKGELYSKGKILKLDNINYDIYNNQFSEFRSNDSLFIFEIKLIDSARINGLCLKPDNSKKFKEVLLEGEKISLYKVYKTEIVEGMFNPIDGSKQPSRFKITDDYLISKNEISKSFSLSKKEISVVVKDHNYEIEKYIDENNLSYKKEADVIRIFKYYNTL